MAEPERPLQVTVSHTRAMMMVAVMRRIIQINEVKKDGRMLV